MEWVVWAYGSLHSSAPTEEAWVLVCCYTLCSWERALPWHTAHRGAKWGPVSSLCYSPLCISSPVSNVYNWTFTGSSRLFMHNTFNPFVRLNGLKGSGDGGGVSAHWYMTAVRRVHLAGEIRTTTREVHQSCLIMSREWLVEHIHHYSVSARIYSAVPVSPHISLSTIISYSIPMQQFKLENRTP